MKPLQLGVLLFAAILICAGLTAIIVVQLTVQDHWIIAYNFTVVSSGIGIIADQSIPLPMGEASPGATLERYLHVGNPLSFPVKVVLSAQGPTDSWVETQRTYVVQPGQTERISLKIMIPPDAPFGDHEGRFLISVYRDWISAR